MSYAGPPLAHEPEGDVEVPSAVRRLAEDAAIRTVWINQAGGMTFAFDDGRFVKWDGSGVGFAAEVERLNWAVRFVAVPRVLGQGTDGEGAWLITSAIAGESAVSPRWSADPGRAVAAIGRGLRVLHDRLPVDSCPFSWSVADRLERARARGVDPSEWHGEHRGLTVDEMIERASREPVTDRLVVCHGDACAPNTIVRANGEPAGHVDLGALGVADPWADLAVATWSADWNYGPGWQDTLLAAYGIKPDPPRMAYYRLLWDLE